MWNFRKFVLGFLAGICGVLCIGFIFAGVFVVLDQGVGNGNLPSVLIIFGLALVAAAAAKILFSMSGKAK